jgi:hypothetical protein
MRHVETAVRLRVFVGEDDKYKGRPLYEEIVVQAQQSHLAGATVFRGYMGYGRASGLNPEKILRSSRDLPIVIELLDTREKIYAFMDILDQILTGGVVTLEKMKMVRYGKKPKRAAAPSVP